jgi:hypothetical protein
MEDKLFSMNSYCQGGKLQKFSVDFSSSVTDLLTYPKMNSKTKIEFVRSQK